MDFKLGEFVRFVDERREGYITKIFDDVMIGVTGDDDFEIPVPANKVTRVHGHTYKGIESQAIAEKQIPVSEFKTSGVHLAILPDAQKGSVVYFHIVNETSYQVLASFSTEKESLQKGVFAGIIAPDSAPKVYSASLTELSNWPKFHIQAFFYSGLEVKSKEPLVYETKFTAKNFSGAKRSVPLLKQEAWTTQIDKKEIVIDAQKLKESFFKPAEEKKEIEKPLKEVDLHIEKLRDDFQFLNKEEILKIQLNHFQKALDSAIVHKLSSVIFIHGLGNGTLRYEIQKVISKHQQVKTYMDAHKERYGYGATEVILK
ncbi:MAG: Smr/MutS family protein [Sphingobacteriaceae bacterium]|nr:Smr/MutS family protein [Sphingobacteriaceae bacterium]